MAEPSGSPDPAEVARREGSARAAGEGEALARLGELLGVVWRLRDDDGCPWDRKQTLESMTGNLVEEVFEAAEAVASRDDAAVAEELGDTLMNVLLMVRIAEQEGRFRLADVAAGIATKLVRRHPHVFAGVRADDVEAALDSWNEAKAREAPKRQGGALAGVPAGLPALLTALRVGQKAAAVGFDWPDATGALAKLDEELAELHAACEQGREKAIEDELGDLIFSAVNVARKFDLDPDLCLRRTILKFHRRFAAVEQALGDGLAQASLEEMERLWQAAAWDEPPV